MLDFLKENSIEKNNIEEKGTGAKDTEATEPQVSQANEAEGPKDPEENEEYLTVAPKEQKTRRSTYALIFFFVFGLCCLVVMIKKSTPQAAMGSIMSPEDLRIEEIISRFGGANSNISSQMDDILKKFYKYNEVHQIPVNSLSKNPFKSREFFSSVTESSSKAVKSQTMQLISIMQSEQGSCCMINDKILFEGDTIGKYNVVKITENIVFLSDGVDETQLKLSD